MVVTQLTGRRRPQALQLAYHAEQVLRGQRSRLGVKVDVPGQAGVEGHVLVQDGAQRPDELVLQERKLNKNRAKFRCP